MSAVLGEYQGKPTISLIKEGQEKWPFSFGYAKAKLIVENIDAIKDFVAKYEAAVARKETTVSG